MADVDVITRFNYLPKVVPNLRSGAARALNSALMVADATSIPITPKDTGLLRSNKDRILASPGALLAMLTWIQEYAIYQEEGTSRGIVGHHFARTGLEAGRATLIQSGALVGGQLI